MAKLSAATEDALDVIAHVAMAHDMAKNIPGMEGFADFYEKSLPVHSKAILSRFRALRRKAHQDLARLIEKDGVDG